MTIPEQTILVAPAPEPGARFLVPAPAQKGVIPDQVRDDGGGAPS